MKETISEEKLKDWAYDATYASDVRVRIQAMDKIVAEVRRLREENEFQKKLIGVYDKHLDKKVREQLRAIKLAEMT